jgi:thioester reductase-like protein
VARAGAGVTAFKPGDRVMASATGCIASHTVTEQGRVMPLPAGMGLEAAGVIVPFMTAWRALVDAGRLRAGERVLIHAGAGGVGLAAIQVAQALGAEVFATAGSPLKRAFLRNLGVAHTFDSRSATFVNGVMAATGGEGVDIVVNSLSGDLLQASFETLRGGGRFIELGKRDIEDDTRIGLRHFRRGLSYVALDLSQNAAPAAFAAVMAEIGSRLETGVLRPLPYRSFDLTEAVDAFAMMSRGAHIGKIILTVDPGRLTVPPSSHRAPVVDPDGAYVVAGGLRGFGMRLGRWLVARGARKLALVGLSGVVPDDQREHLTWMRDQGAEVLILRADLGSRAAVADMLASVRGAFGPITGVVHAAATYSDRLIQDETPDNLALVYRPKASAAWALHEETLGDPLSMFVMCSSVSAILGGVGQIGYAAANAFLDGLARRRAALGLPATVVSLDPISDTGYITRNQRIADYLRSLGFEGVASADVLASIEIALADNRPETIVTGLNWTTWSQMSAGAATMPLLSEVRTVSASSDRVGGGVRERIISAPQAEQLTEAAAYLRTEIAKILRRPEDQIDAETSLEDLGIDSLNMVELVLRMESELAVSLPSSLAMMSPTLMMIATLVVQQLTQGKITEADVETASGGAGSARRIASVETMQADARLAEALDFGRLDLLPGPGAPLRDVLVTGATGVVGSRLVADLLRRGDARIVCLVRAEDDAAATARLHRAVRARDPGLTVAAISARCRVLAADMALPLFGLGPDVHDALAREVGDVFHLAATINHIMPYSVLRGPNVLGALEILKFACECRVKRVHFASSIAVYAQGDLPADRVMPEARPPRHPGGIDTPYAQTKWVAEALATHAAAHGLPVAIHRIGIVVEEDGETLMDEETLVWRLLEANVAIAGVPDVDVPLYLVGSRFVAQAMHEVARHAELPPGPFALVSADGGSLQRVARRLRAQMPDLTPLPLRTWVERLFAAGLAEAGSPLAPYIQMASRSGELEARTEALVLGLSEMPDRFDRGNLLAALNGSGVEDVDVEHFLDRAADILTAKFSQPSPKDQS